MTKKKEDVATEPATENKQDIEDVTEPDLDLVEEVEIEEEIDIVEQMEQEVSNLKDKLLRNQAELENFKKRTNDERMRERKYALSGILTTLLDVVDNFERATHQEIKDNNIKAYAKGFELIEKQLKDILKNNGVEEIDALHKPFNEKEHHSIMLGEDDAFESNVVLEVIQKGYKYKDRILRPAMVKVNK